MNDQNNRRKSKRVLVDFILEVSANDIEGNEYIDSTVLRNVSAGGAKFITHQPGKYFLGQPLEITIYLPRTDDVHACLKGTATVVRTYSQKAPDNSEESEGVGVAVSFDDSLKIHNG